MDVFQIRKKTCFFGICLLTGILFFARAGAQVAGARYNRFEYHRFRWEVLRTPAFRVYFPAGSDSLASFASLHLPDIREEAKRAMGKDLRAIPNVIIYPAPDQLYESNVGLYDDRVQPFPTISLKGNRMALAFTGSYEAFRKQLKTAWVRMVWESAFKSDLEAQATGKQLLIPHWYKAGCLLYFSEGWTLEKEDTLRSLFRQQTGNWEQLLGRYPELAGQAFCYFLCRAYRDDACKQLFFQMQTGKSLARAARLVTKRTLTALTAQCFDFYRQRFTDDPFPPAPPDSLAAQLAAAYPGERLIRYLEVPGQQTLFYLSEKNNRRTVYAHNLRTDFSKRTRLARYALPPWIRDHSEDPYPLLQWDRDGKVLLLALPVKGRIRVKKFTASGRTLDFRSLYGVDGLHILETWNKDRWLLAAFRKGKSDIVLFDPAHLNYIPFTDDAADNTELASDSQGGLIAYRSGFPADSLRHKDTLARPYGIYMKRIPPVIKKAWEEQETLLFADSAYITWHDPVLLPDDRIAVKNTRYGVMETDTFSLTGSRSGIDPEPGRRGHLPPWLQDYLHSVKTSDSIDALERRLQEGEASVLGQALISAGRKASGRVSKDSMRLGLAYSADKVKPYMLRLYGAYFSAGINNDYFINRYQPYRAYLGVFKFPEVGAMAQGGFSDLFEHHHFNIGYRMPTATAGSDFFFRYENTARRPDWHILFFRKVESLQPDPYRDWKDERGRPYPAAARVKTHYYELGFHEPLTYDVSLDFLAAARNDRTVFLSTNRYSLDFEDVKQWWNINSLSLRVNRLHRLPLPLLYKGWEAGVIADGMIALEKPSAILYDARLKAAYHLSLSEAIHFVAQLQAGYSGGQNRILYNFGGLDHNIVPRVDSSVRFPGDAPYAFQTLVTPFRGYAQNSLYGSRFGLANADLYVPLFASVLPLHTSFPSLNNLQLGLFADAATAAPYGVSLFRPGNLLYAYGFSARTLLAGYPIRFDLAWPGSFEKQPVWYLSISL